MRQLFGGLFYFINISNSQVIAPARIFSPGAPYGDSMWYFLIGALAPIPFFFLKKMWPKSLVKYVNMPLFFSGTGMIPPATPQNYVVWGVTGYVSLISKLIEDYFLMGG